MRDVALETMGENGANLAFDAEEQPTDDGRVYRYLIGTYDSPMFLDDGERDTSKLARGADGLPELQGTYRANFAALIPACAADAELPVPVLVFGHGLFGTGQDYLDGGLLRKVANDACVVVVAGDFIGLTNRQLTAVALAMNDLNRGSTLTEKLAQSIINFIALEQIVRGPMAADPRFQIDGVSVVDPTRVYYYGASLGGIMGNLFMAYDPFITRGVLGVPGSNWTMLLERSLPWPALQSALKGAYPNPWDYELNIALIGMAWDPYDPITTAGNVIHDPLPGVPAKQLLLQEAMDDCLVANVATEMTARVLGIPVITPSARGVPWGLEETPGPAPSALARYDEHPQPVPPSNNIPPSEDNGTHSGVHENEALQRQVREFLLEGEVRNECRMEEQPSACDCAALACL
jgi:hypothetical protein